MRKQDQQGDTVTKASRDNRVLANSPSGVIADSDVFTFDRSGRMLTAYSGRYGNTVTYTFDNAGRKATEALTIAAQTYTTGMNYNARGELIKYIYPDGSVFDRLYHPTGNLNQVKLDGTALDTRNYDNGGRLSTSTYSNGVVTTWGYRNDNLVASINTTSPAGTPADQLVGNLAYTWDVNKNKLSETISNVPAAVSGYGFNSVDTTYDFEDRLTQWKRSSGTQNKSWNLTLVGDWTSQTVNGTTTARTHGPTHELLAIGTSPLSYDAKGNLAQDTSRSPTQNYTWDFDNKMKSADIDGNGMSDVTFEYDALGRRVARTQGTDAVVFYQIDQQTVADYPQGGAAASPTYRYFWASYIDELIVRKGTGVGGTVLYASRNQQFSVYSMTNSSGAVVERIGYTTYGQPSFMSAGGTVQSSSLNAARSTFTGREWDAALQLHHFRARWMSGVSGRFVSIDPIRYNGSHWNLYAYVSSSPQNFVDPMGWELTMIPNNIRNHPYTNKPLLPKKRWGETSCNFVVSCACTTDYKWIGGCMLGTWWSDGYHCELKYKLTTEIFIDDKKIKRLGIKWEGVYGHALIHVMNCRRKARELSWKENDHFDSKNSCRLFAIEREQDFSAWWFQETRHGNPESPWPYGLYPIDYDFDNYDLPDVPYPVPLPRE